MKGGDQTEREGSKYTTSKQTGEMGSFNAQLVVSQVPRKWSVVIILPTPHTRTIQTCNDLAQWWLRPAKDASRQCLSFLSSSSLLLLCELAAQRCVCVCMCTYTWHETMTTIIWLYYYEYWNIALMNTTKGLNDIAIWHGMKCTNGNVKRSLFTPYSRFCDTSL